MADQPLSQEMIDALLRGAGGGAADEPLVTDEEPMVTDEPPEEELAAEVSAPLVEPPVVAEAPQQQRTFGMADVQQGGLTVDGVSFNGPGRPGSEAPSVRPAVFSPLPPAAPHPGGSSIDLLLDVPLQVTVELGRTNLSVREVLGLGAGSVVELEKLAGEPVDLLVNSRLIARGEVVVIDESFGVRVTEIVRAPEWTGARR